MSEEIVQQVLKEVGRRSLFGTRTIPICEDWVIHVSRDWVDPLQDLTDQIVLTLKFTGPTKSSGVIMELKCDGMLEVMANAAKLVEDQKKLKWNPSKEKWTF